MTPVWLIAALLAIVTVILFASRQRSCQPIFRWLPVPLWCYLLPLMAVTMGWLPRQHPVYPLLTTQVLPFALGLLLLGVDLPAVLRAGRQALLAAVIGAGAILIGAPLLVWLSQHHLPLEAWRGAGALAGTWTGGTMNLLALRSVLNIPDAVFAPIIIVDAVVAYSWMALLVAASGFQQPMNRWLRATDASKVTPLSVPMSASQPYRWGSWVAGALLTFLLALGARWLGAHLPTTKVVSSAAGWTVLLVTTFALSLSLIPQIRRMGGQAAGLGYPCLYLVLAATGAQADLRALWSAPVWLLVGAGVALLHGLSLLLAGRMLRIPLGILATASQANLGGMVSAPLVGAVYHQSLAPVGLLLAMAGNALGTYLGWLSATFCRWLLP